MTQAMDRCPRCGSHDLRGGKQDLPGGDTLYDFRCNACGLREDHLRSEADFDAWRRRWQSSEAEARRVLTHAVDDGLVTPGQFRALLGLDRVRFTGEQIAPDRWALAALQVGPRAEVWMFTDDDAVAACQRELGDQRIGSLAPAAALPPLVAELTEAVAALWINPFDREAGLVVEGAQLAELIAWARRVKTELDLRARGPAALIDAADLALAVIHGQVATESDRAGEWLAVFTAPDAQAAFTERVPAGEAIAFVHLRGAELRDRLSEIRTDRPGLTGLAINPAGPSSSLRLALPPG